MEQDQAGIGLSWARTKLKRPKLKKTKLFVGYGSKGKKSGLI